jgi:hypothetical protein
MKDEPGISLGYGLGLLTALLFAIVTGIVIPHCLRGSVGSGCYGNGTCNNGLTCLQYEGVKGTCAKVER